MFHGGSLCIKNIPFCRMQQPTDNIDVQGVLRGACNTCCGDDCCLKYMFTPNGLCGYCGCVAMKHQRVCAGPGFGVQEMSTSESQVLPSTSGLSDVTPPVESKMELTAETDSEVRKVSSVKRSTIVLMHY
jgi:hypothetical protein